MNRTRRSLNRQGVAEVVYLFFAFGPFFEAENFADDKSKEELEALWTNHRGAIAARWAVENPARVFNPWTAWRR